MIDVNKMPLKRDWILFIFIRGLSDHLLVFSLDNHSGCICLLFPSYSLLCVMQLSGNFEVTYAKNDLWIAHRRNNICRLVA